jgi:hypothetical protein
MRLLWPALLAAAALALAGCSRTYLFRAELIDGAVVFVPSIRHSNCLWRFEMVDELGQLMWAADRSAPAEPPAVSGAPIRCDNSRPVRYGVAPEGMATRTGPLPLRPGFAYEIRGFGGGRFEGRFRYEEGRVVNLKPREPGD